ncbi:MAG: hypothetical protein AAGF74_07500 [Pseudomonadota bacterium]
MTALDQFDRLEAPGVWRETAEAQRRDVTVSLGEATLTISDTAGRVHTHWSLAAIRRINPGQTPAAFAASPDTDETLEVEESLMVEALSKVQTALERRRPKPGHLRRLITVTVLIALLIGAVLWLPGAMVGYTASVVPDSRRADIGDDLSADLARIVGEPCGDSVGQQVLHRLHLRLRPGKAGRILIVGGPIASAHLPGGILLMNRRLVEDYEGPEVLAGYILAEDLRAAQYDPLRELLEGTGLGATFRLLTTGILPEAARRAHAESILSATPAPVPDDALLTAFAQALVASTPYAYARDVSGETTLGLIEADPFLTQAPTLVLEDRDWVRLQGICDA